MSNDAIDTLVTETLDTAGAAMTHTDLCWELDLEAEDGALSVARLEAAGKAWTEGELVGLR